MILGQTEHLIVMPVQHHAPIIMDRDMERQPNWRTRFRHNEIISLLDINRRYNLAESRAQDLPFDEIISLVGGVAALGELKMGYDSSAGLPHLRVGVAALAGVRPDEVITTQGTALGLFLLAFELCHPGDETVIAMPCFPLFRDSLVGTGVTLHECRLAFDRGFRLTANLLEPLVNERTKLVSIAPQSPRHHEFWDEPGRSGRKISPLSVGQYQL